MQVIITTLPEKLPEDVRAMIDENQPLAAGIRFFEERFTTGGSALSLIRGIGVGILGILVTLFGAYAVFDSATNPRGLASSDFLLLVVGLVLIFGAYLLIGSLGGRQALISAQKAGQQTRYGIFLNEELLVSRSWFDTTVIPRALFKGLAGRAVQYEHGGQVKTFNLPATFIGLENGQVEAAILGWRGRA